jgi:hypothetical protein
MISEGWKIGDLNKSGTYIMPMLGDTALEFRGKNFPFSNFKNCFIGDKNKSEYNNHILLLYKFSGEVKYLEFEERLKDNIYYVDLYDPDPYHTMYVFNVPLHWEENYELFKEGKYSKFENKYKLHIQKFLSLDRKTSPVMQVLYKDEIRYLELEKEFDIKIPRDQEVSSLPNMQIEIYQPEYKIGKVIKPQSEPPLMRRKIRPINNED